MTDMQLHRELAMNQPIITRESHPIGYRETTREWTYDDILDIFPDDDGSLVNPLVRRCQKYEEEIERLRAVEEAHLHSSADDANTIADYQARHETSLEVIRARERQVEAQRVEIERLRDAMTTLRGIIAEKLHLRRCHDCGLEFYAADSVVPYCVCDRCGSRDTRMVRNKKDRDA